SALDPRARSGRTRGRSHRSPDRQRVDISPSDPHSILSTQRNRLATLPLASSMHLSTARASMLGSSRQHRTKGREVVTRNLSIAVWSLLAAGSILCAVAPANAAEQNPNIVFMLVDNLGYGELGVYGGGILRGAPTPRIDKLASEGMRLLNFN